MDVARKPGDDMNALHDQTAFAGVSAVGARSARGGASGLSLRMVIAGFGALLIID